MMQELYPDNHKNKKRRNIMDTTQKLTLLEEMFDMDEGTLDATMELDAIDEWDSMAKLSLIVLMDDECGKTLRSDDIKQFKTIQDILNFMD